MRNKYISEEVVLSFLNQVDKINGFFDHTELLRLISTHTKITKTKIPNYRKSLIQQEEAKPRPVINNLPRIISRLENYMNDLERGVLTPTVIDYLLRHNAITPDKTDNITVLDYNTNVRINVNNVFLGTDISLYDLMGISRPTGIKYKNELGLFKKRSIRITKPYGNYRRKILFDRYEVFILSEIIETLKSFE